MSAHGSVNCPLAWSGWESCFKEWRKRRECHGGLIEQLTIIKEPRRVGCEGRKTFVLGTGQLLGARLDRRCFGCRNGFRGYVRDVNLVLEKVGDQSVALFGFVEAVIQNWFGPHESEETGGSSRRFCRSSGSGSGIGDSRGANGVDRGGVGNTGGGLEASILSEKESIGRGPIIASWCGDAFDRGSANWGSDGANFAVTRLSDYVGSALNGGGQSGECRVQEPNRVDPSRSQNLFHRSPSRSCVS